MSLRNSLSTLYLGTHLRGKKFNSKVTGPDSKGIGILFTAGVLAWQQQVVAFAEELKYRTGETVSIFGFIPKILEAQVTFAFPHFSYSDYGIRPDFKKHRLSVFMERNHKILMNLDLEQQRIMDYVSHYTLAKHKLAINPDFPDLYDIILQRERDAGETLLLERAMEIYLKTLGK